jgi:peroxiredoxin
MNSSTKVNNIFLAFLILSVVGLLCACTRSDVHVEVSETSAVISISDIKVSDIIKSSATITWVTNKPATSEVEYWSQSSKDRQTASSDELTTQHSINLTSLEADTIYHYQVKSIDASGKQAVSPKLALSDKIGKPAPDFILNSLDGRTIKLSDYQGKLVMLDFWALSCSDCIEHMSIIQEASVRIPAKKMAILTIHFTGKESEIRRYADVEELTVPILLDSDGAVTYFLYNVKSLPTTFFIDDDGIIRLIDPEFSNAEELENIFINSLKGL